MRYVVIIACLLSGYADLGLCADGEGLVVHEWGTFTSLYDEQGMALGGINVDDEPVPKFVHNLGRFILSEAFLTQSHWRYRMKAAPRRHPYVTMRLETPVIYFYPPKGARLPMHVDVDVEFHGGWLSEFYPQAIANAPGLRDKNGFQFNDLNSSTVGTLAWKNLQIGTDKAWPKTDEKVWLAPRKTNSTPVQAGDEAEKYVFYRGVGRIDAPLRVITRRDEGKIEIQSNIREQPNDIDLGRMWLADIRGDGKCAFRVVDGARIRPGFREVANCSTKFDDPDYGSENLLKMKADMHAHLVQRGLYDDEAVAMLTTWERAYFKSPGLRVFFMVPDVWVDRVLPLKIPQADEIERVMIGRIELISDQQRELLNKISSGPISDPGWVRQIKPSEASKRFFSGRGDFGDLGVELPEDYSNYMKLGRFRNALIVAEKNRTKSKNLELFIDYYGLKPFNP